jgi:hypothetical protein
MTTPVLRMEFAEAATARRVLSRVDAFVSQMTPRERALRTRQRRTSVAEYLSFAERSVRAWEVDERRRVESVLPGIRGQLRRAGITVPGPVLLIKTTGEEEWNSSYTRSNAIILPQCRVDPGGPEASLSRLLVHELYHVLARADPRRHFALSRSIGFHKMPRAGAHIPPNVAGRSLTNPDSTERYWFETAIRKRAAKVVPILIVANPGRMVQSIHELERSLETVFLLRQGTGTTARVWRDGRVFDRTELERIPEASACEGGELFDPGEILARRFVEFLERKAGGLPLTDTDGAFQEYLRTRAH